MRMSMIYSERSSVSICLACGVVAMSAGTVPVREALTIRGESIDFDASTVLNLPSSVYTAGART